MKVFHGGTDIIKKPSVAFSKNYLDFGKGFYVTQFQQQAEKWALRQSVRREKNPIVNIYELDLNDKKFNVKKFGEANEQWLDFVCACRKGFDEYKKFDAVFGMVANDDVFKTVDLYVRGIWSKERAIEELRFSKANNQICIINQNMIDECLSFIDAYNVERKNK